MTTGYIITLSRRDRLTTPVRRLVYRETVAEATDYACRWLRLDRVTTVDMPYPYDTWTVSTEDQAVGWRILAAGDGSELPQHPRSPVRHGVEVDSGVIPDVGGNPHGQVQDRNVGGV